MTEQQEETAQRPNFVDGGERSVLGPGAIDVVSASTERVIARIGNSVPADIDAAVDGARRAFGEWAGRSGVERAETLRAFADLLEARADDVVRTIASQNGMPVAVGAASEGRAGPLALRYFAQLVSDAAVETERARMGGGRTVVRHEALGVVGVVVPWNFPISLAFFKIAPALAAGCTVVWKPSPETSLDALLVAEIAYEAGLPAGVLNVVTGGRDTGAALVSHPGLDKVAFTGSTAAGRSIAEVCGRLLRPVSLELGGKSAAVVLDDADLENRLADVFAACLLNSGQTCYLGTRVLVPRSRHDEIVDLLASFVSSLRIGDPFDPATQIGPLATSTQRERVEGFISRAEDDGARLVVGGRRPASMARGWYVEPTIFTDVDPASELAQEEVFGPVLAVTAYDSDDHAVELANASRYGLGGSIWTQDADRGLSLARRVRTGTIGLNGYRIDLGAPFGGVGDSGLGSELGPEGLQAYHRTKTIYAAFADPQSADASR